MLIGKTLEELIDNIYIVLTKYTPDRNVINQLEEKLAERNISNASSLLGKITPLETQSQEVIYLVARFLYDLTFELSIAPEIYFTKSEIERMKDYKKTTKKKAEFPIILENVQQLADGQWTATISIQELTSWYDANMIDYNFDTQRDPKYVYSGESAIKKPNVNWDSVDAISYRLLKGLFYSNYITLNILNNGEEDFIYDSDKKILIIKNGKIDILDGFHRSLAMIKAISINKNLDYKTGLMITNFDVPKANEFIEQEDNRNKIDERHIKARSSDNLANDIVKEINTSAKSELRGKIVTDLVLIQKGFGYTLTDIMSDSIELAFKDQLRTRRDASNISDYLIEFFNELYAIRYSDFAKPEYSKNITTDKNMFAFYVILAKFLYSKDSWKQDLERILSNIDFNAQNSDWKRLMITTKNMNVNNRFYKNINKYLNKIILWSDKNA